MNILRLTKGLAKDWAYKAIILLALLSFILVSCNKTRVGTTKYSKQQAADAGQTLTYDQWVAAVGKAKTDALYAGVGEESLNLLAYGAGVSNAIQLINAVTDVNKVIDLMGNSFALPLPTGVGPTVIMSLLNAVDANKQTGVLRSDGADMSTINQDTIGTMAAFLNCIPIADITDKVVALINNIIIDRNMQGANDALEVNNLSKVIGQVTDVTLAVCPLFQQLSAADITTKLTVMMNGTTGITDGSDLAVILDNVTDTTKMSWLISNLPVGSIPALTALVNGVTDSVKLGSLINQLEDSTTWAGQVGAGQTWGAGVPSNPADNGSGMVRMKDVIIGLTTVPNPAKLVRILNAVTSTGAAPNGMTKMMRLIQDLDTGGGTNNDLVFLINSLPDPGVNAVPSDNLGFILDNMNLLSAPKMVTLLNGKRTIPANTNALDVTQNTYLGYLVQLVSLLDNAKEGPLKVTNIIDGVTNMQKMVDLVFDVGAAPVATCSIDGLGGSPTNGERLAQVINDTDKASEAVPRNNAVNTLVYMIENIVAPSKLVTMICGITPANVATLVNEIACVSQATDGAFPNANNTDTAGDQTCPGPRALVGGEGTDMNASGKKLAYVVDQTTAIDDLVFTVNNVTSVQKMAILINTLDIGNGTTTGAVKVATLIDNLEAVEALNTWNSAWGPSGGSETAVNRNGATGAGKLVNMIEYITSLSDVAIMINNTADADMLARIVARTTKSSNLVGLVNGVISNPNGWGVTINDMVALLNGLTGTSSDFKAQKLSALVNNLSDATGTTTTVASSEHILIAELLSPMSTFTQGVGNVPMIKLMNTLTETDVSPADNQSDAAVRTAQVLSGLNANLIYNSGVANITKREGLVRMINVTPGQGTVWLSTDPSNPTIPVVDVNFPGIGPVHLGVMMNNAADAFGLFTMMNSMNITDVVSFVLCTDHVNEDEGPLAGGADPQGDNDTAPDDPTQPDSWTPCDQVGNGWTD